MENIVEAKDLLNLMLNIIKETPCWVWIIFSYLLFVGIKATKARIIWLPRIFIIPVIFIGMKLNSFMNANLLVILNCTFWMASSSFIGYKLASKTTMAIYKDTRSIGLSGSYQIIILFIIFFIIKYAFGFLQHVYPEASKDYLILETGISWIFSGYFLGRAICYVQKYYNQTN